MILARRVLLAALFTLASFASLPAAASRLGVVHERTHILIADPSPALRSFLSASGFEVDDVERLDALNLSLMVATPPRGVPASAALRALQTRFPTVIAALDDRLHLASDAQASRGATAAPDRILSAIGWRPDRAQPGAGMRIGIIDGSIDLAHPALQGAVIVRREFTSGKAPAQDTAHGTAIAAMLVGRPSYQSVSGLLRGATVFYAGIFQDSWQGSDASSADFLRGVNWLIESGATIINASLTSPTGNSVVLYAMSQVSREKAILVAAAGNEGPSAPPSYPAAIPNAFAVTAVSIDGGAYENANVGDYIDIAAPGIDVPTISPDITFGTSLAVPFVTAAVARLVKSCGLSPMEAETRLQASARDLGPRGWDSHFGWGLLQAPPDCDPPSAR